MIIVFSHELPDYLMLSQAVYPAPIKYFFSPYGLQKFLVVLLHNLIAAKFLYRCRQPIKYNFLMVTESCFYWCLEFMHRYSHPSPPHASTNAFCHRKLEAAPECSYDRTVKLGEEMGGVSCFMISSCSRC